MAARKPSLKPPAHRAKALPAVSSNGAGKHGEQRLWRRKVDDLRREIKRLEAARHESGIQFERLANLHNFGPVGCVILNRQGCVVDLNFSAAALLRRTRQALLHLPFAVCLTRDSLARYLDHLWRCRSQHAGIQTDVEIRRADGSPVSIRLLSSPIPTGRNSDAELYQTMLVDTSASSALEQSLRQSEEQLRMALQCANAAHWSIELASARVVWSPEFFQLLGLNPDKVTASEDALLTVVHSEDRMALETAMKALLDGESEHFQGEYRVRGPARGFRWLGMFGRVVRGSQQQPLQVAGIAIDITAQKRNEAMLRKARENLEQRVKERTAHLRSVTATVEQEIHDRRRLEQQILEISEREQQRIGQDLHDGLGQQITGIIFHAHLLHKHLASKGAPEAEAAAYIVSLLDGAKVQARQIARGLQPVDPSPNGLMAGLEHFAATTSDLYRIDCRFSCPEPVLIEDYTTSTHLFRIGQEAVSNAFRHGGASVIEIHLRHAKDGALELEISDNGRGLPKNARRKEGLGLRFMQYRAEMLGGTLVVRRRPRGGTIVTCRIAGGGAQALYKNTQLKRKNDETEHPFLR